MNGGKRPLLFLWLTSQYRPNWTILRTFTQYQHHPHSLWIIFTRFTSFSQGWMWTLQILENFHIVRPIGLVLYLSTYFYPRTKMYRRLLHFQLVQSASLTGSTQSQLLSWCKLHPRRLLHFQLVQSASKTGSTQSQLLSWCKLHPRVFVKMRSFIFWLISRFLDYLFDAQILTFVRKML